jgi:S-adenosylmethionine:tRNA ribosyltransferase-isomerase
LLVLPREAGPFQHRSIRELPEILESGDVLVANDARVIPARLHGRKAGTGGAVELLLFEPLGGTDWLALGQSSKPLRPGAVVEVLGSPVEIREVRGGGELVVRLPVAGEALWRFLDEVGEVPLPPYIERSASTADRDRYQTVYARERGAVAAPTAGLHFTSALIARLRERGVRFVHLTLHVGPGTFLPVRSDRVEDHRMHRERYTIPQATADAVRSGGRVIAVGTTSLRALEASAGEAGPGSTDLFITPGYGFRIVRGLLTNFHLPRSTLLMLVAAFAGLDRVKAAYAEAVRQKYRFFSYGDAMLLT